MRYTIEIEIQNIKKLYEAKILIADTSLMVRAHMSLFLLFYVIFRGNLGLARDTRLA